MSPKFFLLQHLKKNTNDPLQYTETVAFASKQCLDFVCRHSVNFFPYLFPAEGTSFATDRYICHSEVWKRIDLSRYRNERLKTRFFTITLNEKVSKGNESRFAAAWSIDYKVFPLLLFAAKPAIVSQFS